MTTPCTKEKEIELMKNKLDKTEDLLARIDERQQGHDKLLHSIHEQTKRTNGRVDRLEKFRTMILGIQAGIGFVVTVALTILGIYTQFI